MIQRILWLVCVFVITFTFLGEHSALAQVITSVSALNSDAPITGSVEAQRENDLGGAIVPFGEDVFAYTDRTHQYNGPRFTAAGVLTFADTPAAGDVIQGLPGYLLGADYVSTMNGNRDNVGFQLNVGIGLRPATAYLLIDNRVGDTINTNPPTLGSGGVGVMPWVADDGWSIVNTGFSPNGQPDFAAIDEGRTPASFADRIANGANQGTGPGVLINNAFTIYSKVFPAGAMINLKEQNNGGINMYGLVVVPEPSTIALVGCAALGLATMRRRKQN